VKYFNGFSLSNEEILFKDFITQHKHTVAGFSYGAQRAFEYTYTSTHRIDRLVLLSPAFFQDEKSSFIRTQLRYFDTAKEAYISQFLANVTYPSSIDLSEYLSIGAKEDLKALLTYTWDKDKILTLLERGITIEVFLGAEDKIIHRENADK